MKSSPSKGTQKKQKLNENQKSDQEREELLADLISHLFVMFMCAIIFFLFVVHICVRFVYKIDGLEVSVLVLSSERMVVCRWSCQAEHLRE